MNHRTCAGIVVAAFVAVGCGRQPSPSNTVASDAGAPDVARPHKIVLEIDRMAGVPDIQETQTIRGKEFSLVKLYEDAGLEVRIVHDQTDLPHSTPVRRADLHALMTRSRSITPAADEQHINVLVVTSDEADADTLGLMFDYGANDADDLPRQGFAVFAGAHQGLPGGVAPEVLLTTAHELAHCFNVHHPDWEGTSFRRDATVESYSMTDTVRWSLSRQSKRHLSRHPSREVAPGRDGVSFSVITADHQNGHQRSPAEDFRVVSLESGSAARRGTAVPAASVMRTSHAREAERTLGPGEHGLELHLDAVKQRWVVGEPVTVTVGLANHGSESVDVLPLLRPTFRFMAVGIRKPGEMGFTPYDPPLFTDARGKQSRSLAPGEAIYEEVPLFFGSEGWVMSEPGRYLVRADFPIDPSGVGDRIRSGELELELVEPATAADRRGRDLILGKQQGLYLYLQGGDHLKEAASSLRTIATTEPTAAQAPAAKLALGVAALEPTIDPEARVRAEPDPRKASGYLKGLLDKPLPAKSLVRAQEKLADELEKRGNAREAQEVRKEAIRKLGDREPVAADIQELKRQTR